jgi:nuclear transport factor 2 (NTF2) superfamily protein
MLATTGDYFTTENFIRGREYDIRVQKIGTQLGNQIVFPYQYRCSSHAGNFLRAYRRVNANWKGNVGSCVLEVLLIAVALYSCDTYSYGWKQPQPRHNCCEHS